MKISLPFLNSNTSDTYGLYSESQSKIIGQNAADGHLGTTSVARAREATQCLIQRVTKFIGGTSQLLSSFQFKANASTPEVFGV